MKSVFTLGKKKEGLKPVEKAKAEEIVDSLTKKVEANYSLEEVDKAEKEAEKYKDKSNSLQYGPRFKYCLLLPDIQASGDRGWQFPHV